MTPLVCVLQGWKWAGKGSGHLRDKATGGPGVVFGTDKKLLKFSDLPPKSQQEIKAMEAHRKQHGLA